MKPKWKLLSSANDDRVRRMFDHKVCSVAETRIGNYIKWIGLLDNDEYFMVIVLDCILTVACNEREMLLPYGMYALAHTTELNDVVKIPPSQINKTIQAMTNKAPAIAKAMTLIKFEDVMKVLGWQYISEKVEIFETNFL